MCQDCDAARMAAEAEAFANGAALELIQISPNGEVIRFFDRDGDELVLLIQPEDDKAGIGFRPKGSPPVDGPVIPAMAGVFLSADSALDIGRRLLAWGMLRKMADDTAHHLGEESEGR